MTTALAKKESLSIVPVQTAGIFFDVEKFNHCQRVAMVLAQSKTVPEQFRKSVPDCIIALNLADRLRLDVYMMMQSMYVVHGRPGIEGKLRIALINAAGRFEPLEFRFEPKDEAKWPVTSKKVKRPDKCTAFAKDKKTGKTIEASVSWQTVQAEGWDTKSGSKWLTMPEQMFCYRAAAFFERRYCPDVSLGLRDVDELQDIIDITPAPVDMPGVNIIPGDSSSQEEIQKTFDELIVAEGLVVAEMDAFLEETAAANDITVDELKEGAAQSIGGFITSFQTWKFHKKEASDFQPDHCPDDPDTAPDVAHCTGGCSSRADCPAWEEHDKKQI